MPKEGDMSFLGKRIEHGFGSASEDEEYEASRRTEEKQPEPSESSSDEEDVQHDDESWIHSHFHNRF